MSNFEKKFGKYAISNLSLKLTIVYAIGYLLFQFAPDSFISMITLDAYSIVARLQIWRLLSWILMPIDQSGLFFFIITLYFYYWIGSTMERTLGAYRYNLYIFTGMLLTIAGAFLMVGYFYLTMPELRTLSEASRVLFFQQTGGLFSMFYVNMSILLAFSVTYPDNVILLMFIIPIKMKWLGVFYIAMMLYEIVRSFMAGSGFVVFAIAPALVNFFLFWLVAGGRLKRMRPKEVKRRQAFHKAVKMAPPGQPRHRCAICGRTELDDPSLEFRYCSKCKGNYEYCQEHLFTHVHKT